MLADPRLQARFLFKVHVSYMLEAYLIVIDSDLAYLHEYERSTVNYFKI
jgi:hypothetical protein